MELLLKGKRMTRMRKCIFALPVRKREKIKI